MHIHARGKARIMDLHTLNFVLHDQPSPTVVHGLTIGKKLKISFDVTRDLIGFGDAQPKPVLIEWTGRGIPELR
jgi:hypothetical protein